MARQDPATTAWINSQQFKAERNRLLVWPAPDGKVGGAVFGLGNLASAETMSIWQAAALADRLPAGRWTCRTALSPEPASRLALGFALGSYRFDRYRSAKSPAAAQLVMPAGADAAAVRQQWCALTRARDLINTPANNLGPAELTDEVQALADQFGAPLRLRLLIAAVENSVGSNAYRPGDVLKSRKGLTVEIGNTDAEGRLVLADALADADSESPALLVDFATLTGAARTALGSELPAAFSPDRALLAELVAAGATIGALFLKRFVTATKCWIHLDLYAWNARERPGRPAGAEAQCARAVLRLVRGRFG